MADIAKVDSVAVASVAKFLGRTKATGDSVMNVLYAAAGGGIISSIQEVEITISSSSATGTATITSVDTSRTAVFFSYNNAGAVRQTLGNIDAPGTFCRVSLTNATTVTATRGSASAFSKDIVVTVVEYSAAAVDSVQQGTIAMTNGIVTATDTITSVTTSRSVALFNGDTISAFVGDGRARTSVSLTNATTVTATRGTGTASAHTTTSGYVVIEFAAGITDSVQEFEVTISSGTSATATISSVDTSKTATFPGGMTTPQTTSDMAHEYCYCALTNATTVTATKGASGGNTVTINGTMVEFADDIVNTIQRGVVTMAGSDLTKDTTITAVDLSLSTVQALGGTSTSTAAIDPEETYFTLEFTSTTNIQSAIGDTGSGRDVIYSYEVVEYVA